jgi:hypothetical protein
MASQGTPRIHEHPPEAAVRIRAARPEEYPAVGDFHRTPDRDWEPMPGARLLTYALDLR